MSEPTTFADSVETPLPRLLHWTLQDDRISFRADAYGLVTPDGVVLIDPLPLSDAALDAVGPVKSICLTEGQHQRSAWRYRRRFGVPVHAPHGAHELEEGPDHWFGDGDALPGDLRSMDTPGFGTVHCAFVAERGPGGRVLFSGDLVVCLEDGGAFALIPDKYVDDPEAIRASVARLLNLAPDVLCPAHGAPVVGGAGAALEQALQVRT